jgi:hypothetical protein
MRASIVAAALTLALTGCRAHFERTRVGDPLPPEKLVQLVPGKSNLDEALALLGAPDGMDWTETSSVLVYDSWKLRTSHWEAENPSTYIMGGPIGPTTFLGEIPTYVLFVNAKSGAPLPSRLPQTPGAQRAPTPQITNKPVTLDGSTRGHDQVRVFFDNETLLLDRIEVSAGAPGTGLSDTAAGTFLK